MDLKTYFETTGVTQTFFAKKANISRTTINKILDNKIHPTLKTAWAIEKATDGKVTLYDWIKVFDSSKSNNIED